MSPPRKLFCKNGHPRTPNNVDTAGKCRICSRARAKQFRAENPGKYLDKVAARNKRNRETLADSYINLLIHAKTGIPYEEITEEDRKERRRIVLKYRARKQGRQA